MSRALLLPGVGPALAEGEDAPRLEGEVIGVTFASAETGFADGEWRFCTAPCGSSRTKRESWPTWA